ncbi:J domain-containing protein [Aphelenchoides bicaudatus]|nr:J domain-containing protein [Aphelenchoides bicaudatus]
MDSDDSLFDDDENLVLSEQEEIDYYAILNIPRDASVYDINKAYKTRCLLFHPDRHTDEQAKKDAEKIFVVLKKAHETLIDPQKRAIYDAVGLRGLEMQGWQLVPMSSNPENIRREYEFLKKLRETEIMIQRTHPTSSFHVKVHAAGLFCSDPEDRYAPSLSGLSIYQSVDSALTSNDRVGLSGKVQASNGRGDGQMVLNWKRSISSSLHVETQGNFTSDSATGVLKITKSITPNVLFALAPTVTYIPIQGAFDASVGTTLSMQLAHNWQGSVAFGTGLRTSYISTTLIRTELNQQQASFNLTLSPINSFIKGTYIWRFPDIEAQLDTSCLLGLSSTIVSLNYEQRLSRYSRIGCGISFNYPAFLLVSKLRFKTSLNHYELHLILCDNQDEIVNSVIFGAVLPYVAFQAVKVLFRRPLSRLLTGGVLDQD